MALINDYLPSTIDTDFSENSRSDVDETLDAIEKVERGDLEAYHTGREGFCHHITRDRVRFEHSVFGECPEWPIWCCMLAQ